MNLLIYALQDWTANSRNLKGRLVMVLFRVAQIVRRAPRPLFILGIPYLVCYRVTVEWFMGIELPWNTKVGPGLRIYHGYGLVVNDGSVIGRDCVLRHSTTLGHRSVDIRDRGLPTLGDRVNVGPNVVILGPVFIGDGAIIGAGAVVLTDVPPDAVAVGNPARVIRSPSTVVGPSRSARRRHSSKSTTENRHLLG